MKRNRSTSSGCHNSLLQAFNVGIYTRASQLNTDYGTGKKSALPEQPPPPPDFHPCVLVDRGEKRIPPSIVIFYVFAAPDLLCLIQEDLYTPTSKWEIVLFVLVPVTTTALTLSSVCLLSKGITEGRRTVWTRARRVDLHGRESKTCSRRASYPEKEQNHED